MMDIKRIIFSLLWPIWYVPAMLFFAFLAMADHCYEPLQEKGEWLPKEQRYENLKLGQWRDSIVCRLTGHDSVDPRIAELDKPQTEEKCTRCGIERKL